MVTMSLSGLFGGRVHQDSKGGNGYSGDRQSGSESGLVAAVLKPESVRLVHLRDAPKDSWYDSSSFRLVIGDNSSPPYHFDVGLIYSSAVSLLLTGGAQWKNAMDDQGGKSEIVQVNLARGVYGTSIGPYDMSEHAQFGFRRMDELLGLAFGGLVSVKDPLEEVKWLSFEKICREGGNIHMKILNQVFKRDHVPWIQSGPAFDSDGNMYDGLQVNEARRVFLQDNMPLVYNYCLKLPTIAGLAETPPDFRRYRSSPG